MAQTLTAFDTTVLVDLHSDNGTKYKMPRHGPHTPWSAIRNRRNGDHARQPSPPSDLEDSDDALAGNVQSGATATAGAQRGAAEDKKTTSAAAERWSKTAVKKVGATESPRIVRQQLIKTADDRSPRRQSVQAEVHRSFIEDSSDDEAAKGISKMKYGRRRTSGYFSRSDHVSPRRYKLISASDSENEDEVEQYESEGRRSDKNQSTLRSVSNRRSDSNEVPSRSEKLNRRPGRYRSSSQSDTEARSVELRRRWKDDQSDHEVIANQGSSKPRVKSVVVVPEVKVQKSKYVEVEPKHAEAKSDRHRHRSSSRHRRRRHRSDSSSSD